jgi:hypothetical protein
VTGWCVLVGGCRGWGRRWCFTFTTAGDPSPESLAGGVGTPPRRLCGFPTRRLWEQEGLYRCSFTRDPVAAPCACADGIAPFGSGTCFVFQRAKAGVTDGSQPGSLESAHSIPTAVPVARNAAPANKANTSQRDHKLRKKNALFR